MMRRFDTKRRRRKSDEKTGRTSVSSWTACPGAYPAYPAMSESPEKVVRTSSRVQTQAAERARATEEEEYHLFFTTSFFFNAVEGSWWCLFFLSLYDDDIFQNAQKQTNKQTNKHVANERTNERTKKRTNTPKFSKSVRNTHASHTCVRDK